ncbi:polysaccharide lyase 6 family protein [Pendulispora brunnea]|uniref:Polysaccharide lyase 6 family protein n=1 Tax=Pendulispora brunnea TaxID=2905690 RepID=A0ABZ2K660_9BACT
MRQLIRGQGLVVPIVALFGATTLAWGCAGLSSDDKSLSGHDTGINGGGDADRLTEDPVPVRVITASSIAELQAALDKAAPGDRIELTNGSYTLSSAIRFSRSGTAAQPITVAAQNTGGAELTGSATFNLSSVSYVGISGFKITTSAGVSIPGNADHIRFSRNTIEMAASPSTKSWVTVAANDTEVDHNTFQNKSTEGVYLQITGPGEADMARGTWVHHNYFYNHTYGGTNGGESVRLGLSKRQHASAEAKIEYNLFEKANGDAEAISVKSSNNVVRYNTIRDSIGSIVLRHGNANRVEGNIELGGSSGIRLYENDHVIVNNLIQGGTGQILVGSGTLVDDTNNGTEHARVDRALIAFNTVVGSGRLLDIGPGSDPYGPDDCTFANNIFQGGESATLIRIGKATNLHWDGNIVWGGSAGATPSSGYRNVDPALGTDADGLYRLTSATGPAIDAAQGSYPQVTLDIDLQTRSGAKDVGADEFVAGGTPRRPLSTADVGPSAP